MSKEIKYAIFLIGVGLAMLAYLHATFFTRAEAKAARDNHLILQEQVLKTLKTLEKRIYDIHRHVVP